MYSRHLKNQKNATYKTIIGKTFQLIRFSSIRTYEKCRQKSTIAFKRKLAAYGKGIETGE
jgi:hypothetical protein